MKAAFQDPVLGKPYRELRAWARPVLFKILRWLFVLPLLVYLYGIPFVQERLWHVIPEKYRLSLKEAVILGVLFAVLERVVSIEQTIQTEITRSKRFWMHPSREEAAQHICAQLCHRGSKVKRVDMLQFSGDTAIPVLKQIAISCPNAAVRLFLVPEDVANSFDEPGFHWIRVQHTIGVVQTIYEDPPGFRVEVWSYKTAPSIAGIIVDDWLVSAGWYHTFPSKKNPARLSIRGHASPAFTAVDDQADPLLFMVRAQFDAVQKIAKLEFKLPEEVSQPPQAVSAGL